MFLMLHNPHVHLVDIGRKMHKRLHILILSVGVVMLLVLTLTTKGPSYIVEKIDLNGEQLSHGERPQHVINIESNDTLHWMMSYLEHLRNAYEIDNQSHVNPHNFKLLLDEPMACMDIDKKAPKRVLLLVLIVTVHGNFRRRQAIRKTWGSPKELGGLPVVTLFLLGKNNGKNMNLNKNILDESAQYHDLLMEDFQDSYRNLTLKTLMAMKWASTHCPQASYFMKTDDDMYVSYRNVLNFIAISNAPNINFALGLVLAGQAPIRDVGSKWYMPKDLFPGDVYPPWLSGGGFVLSGDVPENIYAASLDINFLHLEDVYVGFCLEKLKITPVTNIQFNNMKIPYSYCRYRNVMTSHHLDPHAIETIWADQEREVSCWFLT